MLKGKACVEGRSLVYERCKNGVSYNDFIALRRYKYRKAKVTCCLEMEINVKVEIRKATEKDIAGIADLYNKRIDYLEETENYPGWKKEIYPTQEDAETGVAERSIFVAEENGKIAGTFILRHKPEAAYAQAHWQKELLYDKVFVIYTFAVHPDYAGKGVGFQMLQYIEQYAKEQKVESIRLDVVDVNVPAIHLYEKSGFTYIDTVDLGLGSFGLKWFKLYEKLI